MGMFDSFFIEHNNKLNIPSPAHEDQTKDLGQTLARFTISVDGVIRYTPSPTMNQHGVDFHRSNDAVLAVQAGTFCDPHLNIYGDSVNGQWEEFYLTVVNNVIMKVEHYDNVIYTREGKGVIVRIIPDDETIETPESKGVILIA